MRFEGSPQRNWHGDGVLGLSFDHLISQVSYFYFVGSVGISPLQFPSSKIFLLPRGVSVCPSCNDLSPQPKSQLNQDPRWISWSSQAHLGLRGARPLALFSTIQGEETAGKNLSWIRLILQKPFLCCDSSLFASIAHIVDPVVSGKLSFKCSVHPSIAWENGTCKSIGTLNRCGGWCIQVLPVSLWW